MCWSLSVLEALLSAVGSSRQTRDVSTGFRALKSQNTQTSTCGEFGYSCDNMYLGRAIVLEYANATIHPAEGTPRRIETRC